MKVVVQSLWTYGDAMPGQSDFNVLVNVSLGEESLPGGEVFQFRAVSPSTLAETEPGTFMIHTLVLDTYSEDAIRARLDKLLAHSSSAPDWDSLIQSLSGYLRHEP